MPTTASRREGFDLPAVDPAASAMRDAAQGPGSERRSPMPERWLLDLVGLALVGFLLLAAALAGLGAVSTSVPLRPAASGFIGGHASGVETLDLRGGPVCCYETER
jgi:hypothetical protein